VYELFIFRISTLKEVYEENCVVTVFTDFEDASINNKTEYFSHNERLKKFNSWFYIDFGDKVFVPKGANCVIQVRSSNVYQLIPFTHIRENMDKVRECEAFSVFGINFFEQEQKDEELNLTDKSLEEGGKHFFCLKIASQLFQLMSRATLMRISRGFLCIYKFNL